MPAARADMEDIPNPVLNPVERTGAPGPAAPLRWKA